MIKSEKFFELERLGIRLKTVVCVPEGVELKGKSWEGVIDELSEIFCESGLKSNDEPNQIGFLVENLIDLVNEELQPKLGSAE